MYSTTCKYLALAAISANVSAQSAEVKAQFPDFAEFMDGYGATWEVYTAVTDDSWELDIFRITGFTDSGPIEITKPPLVVYHPMLANCEFWIDPVNHPTGEYP